jgi:hypothetical protein
MPRLTLFPDGRERRCAPMVVQARKPLRGQARGPRSHSPPQRGARGASLFPACFSFCLTDSGDETTTEAHRRIASEPSQMQGCDKRNRGDSGLPRDLTIPLRISVEPTVTVR